MPSPSSEQGFTLIESLVALFLVSVALLIGLPLLQSQPAVLKRLEAQRTAIRELGSTLEALRSGAIPLAPTHLGTGTADQPLIWVTVDPVPGDPGLNQVGLRAQWRVRGQDFEKRVQTMIWRPE